MEPFPPLAESGRSGGLATVASVFPDFSRTPLSGGASDLEEAHALAERQVAEREAHDAGFAAGRAAAEEAMRGAAAGFAQALEEVVRFRTGLLQRYQQELLELAIGIARKVVQRELAEHPEHWLGMIREAVQHALDRERIRIRVGRVLHRYLLEELPALRALLEEVKELDLVEDGMLAENGCVLETHYGDLDLSIDSQMSAIRAALTHAE